MGSMGRRSAAAGLRSAGLGRRAAGAGLLCAAGLALAAALLWGAGAASAQEPAGAPVTYTVQPGDTLYTIAQRFGTTVDALAAANGIADPALIAVGQKLTIPAAGPEPEAEPPRSYVVQPGDTLFGIAQTFGTTVKAITDANAIADPSFLEIGQRLTIPAAAEAPAGSALVARRVHIAAAGETLPGLAFRYGLPVWRLREANGLSRLGLVLPGQALEIPPATIPGPATPRMPAVSTAPEGAVQGQTLVVRVRAGPELALSGRFLDQQLEFASEGELYWAPVGVDALAAPGVYTVTLEAAEVGSGDRLWMELPVQVAAGTFGTVNIPVPADRLGLLDPALSAAEREKVAQAFSALTPAKLWAGAFGYPLADVVTTAGFGQRRSYAGGPVSSYHGGQDLGAAAGTPVYAPAAGTVVLAEALQVRGNAIILDHGLGVLTGYWHLSQVDVAPGQEVAREAVIGLVGNTGLSTGPHLHWEMQVRGVPVDPLQWTRQAIP